MFGIDWRELRLPPPPGSFIVQWIIKQLPDAHLRPIWWVEERHLRDSGEPKGFIPGTYGLFDSLVPLFLGAGCLHDNNEVVGVKNAREFVRRVDEEGLFGSIVADHKGFADNFLLQVDLAVKCGLWEVGTRRLLPIIGLMYASRYIIQSIFMRATNLLIAVPPTMEIPRSARKEGSAIWDALKEQYPYYLSEGYIGLIFAEGTRSRSGKMIEPPSGIAEVLKHPGSIYLLTAIEGTEKVMPPADERGIPLPDFMVGTRIIFGVPVTYETVDEEVKQLQQQFKVNYRRAFIDVLYRKIALLHIEQGEPSYAGYYEKPLEEIYREKGLTRE